MWAVEGDHEILIELQLKAEAVTLVGVVGGWVFAKAENDAKTIASRVAALTKLVAAADVNRLEEVCADSRRQLQGPGSESSAFAIEESNMRNFRVKSSG